MYLFQFAYKDGFEYMKTTLETEELDAPVSYCYTTLFMAIYFSHFCLHAQFRILQNWNIQEQ